MKLRTPIGIMVLHLAVSGVLALVPTERAHASGSDSIAKRSSSLPTQCFTKESIRQDVELILSAMTPLVAGLTREIQYVFKDYSETNETERWPLALEINSYSKPFLTIEASGRLCGTGLSHDALLLVLCHEIGHLGGGGPTRSFNYDDISFSTERYSDFFATSVCLPSVLKDSDGISYANVLDENQSIKTICGVESTPAMRALCARIVLASLNLSQSFYQRYDTGSDDKDPGPKPSLNPPTNLDYSGSWYYKDIHPKPQCRLDTYLAGLKCRTLEPTNLFTSPDAPTSCGLPASAAPKPYCWGVE